MTTDTLDIPEVGGRRGKWAAFHDGTAGNIGIFRAAPGLDCQDRRLIQSVATGSFLDWGTGVSVSLDEVRGQRRTYDASGYDGFFFSAWADRSFTLYVEALDTPNDPVQGTCVEPPSPQLGEFCWGFYRRVLRVGPGWQQYFVDFEDMRQPAWAQATSFRADLLIAFQFRVEADVGEHELWVDSIGFIR